MSTIEEIVSRQVESWHRSLHSAAREGTPAEHWPVITISREFGAKGAALAGELSERLGFSLWNKEIVQAIAEDANASETVMESLDEKRQKAVEDAVLGALMGSKVTNVQYVRSLMRLIHVVTMHGSAVIVGRGANFICRPDRTLRLRVVAPLSNRAANYGSLMDMTEREARREVQRRDAERADFVQYTFRRRVDEAASYDLILNSAAYPLEKTVELALMAYRIKFGRIPPVRSRDVD